MQSSDEALLKVYERATGQQTSIAESAIAFGAKVAEASKEAIKGVTGTLNEGGSWFYLGLHKCFSGSKTEILAYIYDRLWGWFTKLLLLGGKEIFIKVIATAMPVYAMHVQ